MMTFETAPVRSRRDHLRGMPDGREIDPKSAQLEIGALRAENAELRKIVIELSKLVVRNVLRNEPRP
jgi:hypothetical protein